MSVEKSPAGRGDVRIYKMRDLNQRTAEVIQEINDSGKPAIVTRHGRFVALISPLLNKGLEGELIARFLEQEAVIGGREPASTNKLEEVSDQLTEDLARRLGIDWT
ncbi:hypothetical protein GBF35_45845 [Nonomuraea phyllanthi]|uniref:hypothetical protein n=1 Tax=Nonomuraea phyllanthi TaxID=2219224 RepID=UPI001292F213|nr:hypothetical protein [Nonomuraea phyllanthi]QFY12914.1 hypothetical protein GBF35_45845 [Nonomuraea phyllanthi]